MVFDNKNMVIKLYQGLDNQWFFSRFGKEYWLGGNISKVLSFFSVCKKSEVLYVKCIFNDIGSRYLGCFYITTDSIVVSSNIFSLFNLPRYIYLPSSCYRSGNHHLGLITKIW